MSHTPLEVVSHHLHASGRPSIGPFYGVYTHYGPFPCPSLPTRAVETPIPEHSSEAQDGGARAGATPRAKTGLGTGAWRYG